ncbi:hypothetical protein SAMN05444366_1799 [Flavobacterium saccharophilum]|uniref:Uncharacterized protein n=1 Tax=Flavobacterium saccharophilum TaxID=29534 RepID=A0A1M7E1D4_9FLAO|nr:hypothetical protein SAMN05444366_1799 [Flavobacterium saccharophilum]
MIRKILSPIIISVIQIVVLAIIHQSLNYFYPIQHRSVGFGLTILSTRYVFIFSIFLFNFYLEFFRRNIYWIGFCLLILTSILPLSAFNERPFRSLFLILLTLCGFLSSLALNKWRMKINMKTETNF